MTEEIRNFIVNYIEKKGKLPSNTNIEEFNYIETGYIDSMGLIQFIVKIEEKFDIEIEDEEMLLPEFKTIGGLTSIIKEKL